MVEKMVTPLASESPTKTFNISFKFYERVERSFRMPPDAIVESMQVKVFENGRGAGETNADRKSVYVKERKCSEKNRQAPEPD